MISLARKTKKSNKPLTSLIKKFIKSSKKASNNNIAEIVKIAQEKLKQKWKKKCGHC